MKRFLYFWRLPLFFFIMFFVLLFLADPKTESAFSTACSVIWLCIDIPCLVIFTLIALYKHIRSFIEFLRTGEKEDDYEFVEITFIEEIFYKISDEFSSVADLSGKMKARYVLFRILGIVLIIGGSIACILCFDSYLLITLFTLVIIGGATLCIIANPKSYNENVEGVQMIPCPSNMTEQDLYQILSTKSTPLGYPRFAKVRGFKKSIMVYGSDLDAYIYAVYQPKHASYFYVSTLSSICLLQHLDPSVPEEDENDTTTYYSDSDSNVYQIAAVVEDAVSSFEEEQEN